MENMPFTKQINVHQQSLHNFAMSFTKNEEDANDLVQDTFLKAIGSYHLYTEGTNLKAWLYTILKNTYLNAYRRTTRRNKVLEVTDEFLSHQLVLSSATNRGVEQMVSEDITKAMKMLPDMYRTPFLKFFEGFKYIEIADELNIPIGTVKTRIHIARKILQNKLKMYN
jgi:RNA polymerase sigma factor (sigma-70 family)